MQDEEELLRQLRETKTREMAFMRLVRMSQEQLYCQIRRIVLTHENADDVLQNVYIKAWSNIETFKGDSKLTTWLYRIAVNESINFMKRHRETHSIDNESETSLLASDPYFDGDDTQRKLQNAINTLPQKQRIVFNMRYFDEISYNEMSAMLDTSVGALKASYHHAVQKILAYFENHD